VCPVFSGLCEKRDSLCLDGCAYDFLAPSFFRQFAMALGFGFAGLLFGMFLRFSEADLYAAVHFGFEGFGLLFAAEFLSGACVRLLAQAKFLGGACVGLLLLAEFFLGFVLGLVALLLVGEVAEALGFGFAGLPCGVALGVAFGGFFEDGQVGVVDAEFAEEQVEPAGVIGAEVDVLLALQT
jgi:hypothetical protein